MSVQSKGDKLNTTALTLAAVAAATNSPSMSQRVSPLKQGESNDQHHQELLSPTKTAFSSISIKEAASLSSSDSEDLNQITSLDWPVLQIDDSSSTVDDHLKKNETIKSDQNDETRNNDCTSIPENVKSALEHAGFNLDQIIDMTNQLRQSFPNKDRLTAPSICNNRTTTVSELASFTNLRDLEVTHGMNAKVTKGIEQNDMDSLALAKNMSTLNEVSDDKTDYKRFNGTKHSRKKSSTSRYATITLPPSDQPLIKTLCPKETTDSGSSDNFSDLPKLKYSPSWSYNFSHSTPVSPMNPLFKDNSMGSRHDLNSKIIPPKVFPKFKPVVSVHKRSTSTSTDEMRKLLMSSLSTDSFLSHPNEEKTDSNTGESHLTEETNIAALAKKSPASSRGSGKRKLYVTRSFSYNVGKLVDVSSAQSSRPKSQMNATDSPSNSSNTQTGKMNALANANLSASQNNSGKDLKSSDSISFKSKSSMSSINDLSSGVAVAGAAANTQLNSPSTQLSDLFIKEDLFKKSKTSEIKAVNGGVKSGVGLDSVPDMNSKKFNSSSFRQSILDMANSGESKDLLSPVNANMPISLSATDLKVFDDESSAAAHDAKSTTDLTTKHKPSQDFFHVSRTLKIIAILWGPHAYHKVARVKALTALNI